MNQVMTDQRLEQENRNFRGSGGISEENRSLGFLPAFLDTETGRVHASRFANGQPAPIHLLDGLPPEVVLARDANGRVARVKASVVSGFVLEERFFTREEASSWLGQSRAPELAH